MSSALLHFLWQGMLLSCLLWLVLFAMRRSSPNARYVVSCVALLLMALAPAFTAAILYSRPAPVKAALDILRGAAVMHVVPDAAGLRGDAIRWVLPVWGAGVVIFALRLLWAQTQISSLRRRAQQPCENIGAVVSALAQRMGLVRPVDLRISASMESPGVLGWLRPILLVPASTIAGLTPDQFESVLAHELAHIRRYDYMVNAAQVLIETLLFYHPAVWWTSARIRFERELCCDDLAVSCCGDAVCYARALAKLERLRLTTPALALGSTGGALLYRIQRLVGGNRHEIVSSKLPVLLGLCFAVISLVFYLGNATAQEKAPQPPPVSDKAAAPPAPAVKSPPLAAKKPAMHPCTESDVQKIEDLRRLQQEKLALESRLQSLRAQMSFYGAMSNSSEISETRAKLAEVERVLRDALVRVEQLRQARDADEQEVKTAEVETQALRLRVEQAIAEDRRNVVAIARRSAQVEQAVGELQAEVFAVEQALQNRERSMEEAFAHLTAHQRGCMAR
jgi:beta-lactamase regulating signal transducer with metallopeptidase domain